MSSKRYDMSSPDGEWEFYEYPDGKWVLYEDHVAEVERLTRERDEAYADLLVYKEEFPRLRLKLIVAERERDEARAQAVVWRDAVTDPPSRHGTYVTDAGLAQWVVWTRTWVWAFGESQQEILTPRVWTALPTPEEADRA